MLAKKKRYSDYDMEIDGSPRPVLRRKEQPKGIFVEYSHLVMFLSFITGMMFLVFSVAYHSGRSNGRSNLLEDVSGNEARLPIVTTMAKGETEDLLSLVKAKAAQKFSLNSIIEEKQNIDFASSTKLPSVSLVPGWYMQAAATGSLEKANKIKNIIDSKNLNAHIKRISVRKRNVFKILVGPYSTKKLANSKSKQVKVTKVDPFAVNIK